MEYIYILPVLLYPTPAIYFPHPFVPIPFKTAGWKKRPHGNIMEKTGDANMITKSK